MPIYDYLCPDEHLSEKYVQTSDKDKQACWCGRPARRVWTGHAPAMRPDSIPGGLVLENLTPRPKRYYSRSEIKDEMRVRGVEQRVRHVGKPGSDKNPHTSRWV